MKRLITLISTKGKMPEQVHQELQANLEKYQRVQKELQTKESSKFSLEQKIQDFNKKWDPNQQVQHLNPQEMQIILHQKSPKKHK